MKHYVYKITNIKENKHYIGVRTSKNPIKDLGIKYFSSSTDKEFMLEQQEFPERFKYKILEVFFEREDAVNKEIELHDKYDVAVNGSFYNRAKQTSSGFCRLNSYHTSETIERMRSAKSGENNPMWSKNHSEETLEKMRSAKSGENHPFWCATHSEEVKEKIRISRLGKAHSEETKEKISEALTGRTLSEEAKENMKSAQQKRGIKEAFRFIIHDSEGNLVHDEVIINFTKFCKENGYPVVSFRNSHRTNEPVNRGKYIGWIVQRTEQ